MCRPERLLEYVLRLVLERIAAGRGTSVQDVNQLLRQYAQMAKMFKAEERRRLRLLAEEHIQRNDIQTMAGSIEMAVVTMWGNQKKHRGT
jgi:signal recognition particle GTPase